MGLPEMNEEERAELDRIEAGPDDWDADRQAHLALGIRIAQRQAAEGPAGWKKLAERCLSLDREPQAPVGGMRTGDMIEVGLSDWHRHQRLARWITRAPDAEPS